MQLIFSSLYNSGQTLRFEIQRKELENAAKSLLIEKSKGKDYPDILFFYKKSNLTLWYALAINKSSYKIISMNISNTFDSTAYTNFHQFLAYEANFKKKDKVKKLKFQALERLIFYMDQQPYLLSSLHGSESNAQIEDQLKQLSTNLEVIELK